MTQPTDLNSSSGPRPVRRLGFAAALGCAIVAGLFVLAVSWLLVENHRERRWNPLDEKEFLELKSALKLAPKDEALLSRLREADHRLRVEHFERLGFSRRGAWLLLGGVAFLVVSLKVAVASKRRLPAPLPLEVEAVPPRTLGRRVASVALVGAGLAVAAAVLGIFLPARLPPSVDAVARAGEAGSASGGRAAAPADAAPTDAPVAEAAATPEEFARNWHRFRGPGGRGIAAPGEYPVKWNGASGEGVVWKTELSLPGENSPVVWDDRIFLSGATADRREVQAYDRGTGKLLWKKSIEGVPGSPPEAPEIMEATGHAASTLATDGRRVFAIFANADLACLTVEGKDVWSKNVGPLENIYGHSSSLEVGAGLLFVLLDQASAEDGKSRLVAFDAVSGKQVWQTSRPVSGSWGSPVLAQLSTGPQVLTSATPFVMAHDPSNGKELWRADCMGGDVASSPTWWEGVVYAAHLDTELVAIRADGKGDVTETHILWRAEDGLPDVTSPLTDGKYVFLVSTPGRVTCYEAATGTKLWQENLKLPTNASPSFAGGRVYIVTNKGIALVLEPGAKFQELGRSEFGEAVRSTPAFVGGRIYVRGEKHLYCLGKP